MISNTIQQSFLKLKSYCEKEQYKGWDPYDGLNSTIFQALPLKHWDLARLTWIQGFKICGIGNGPACPGAILFGSHRFRGSIL